MVQVGDVKRAQEIAERIITFNFAKAFMLFPAVDGLHDLSETFQTCFQIFNNVPTGAGKLSRLANDLSFIHAFFLQVLYQRRSHSPLRTVSPAPPSNNTLSVTTTVSVLLFLKWYECARQS